MATYKVRGTAHNVIYPYRAEDGKVKQQWETYSTELEAMHRKAYLQKTGFATRFKRQLSNTSVSALWRER